MSLEDDTPAKQALQEFLRPVKKPRGLPITTWLKKNIKRSEWNQYSTKPLKCDTSADIWKTKNKNLW